MHGQVFFQTIFFSFQEEEKRGVSLQGNKGVERSIKSQQVLIQVQK